MENVKRILAIVLVGTLLVFTGCQAAPAENSGGVSGTENMAAGSGGGRFVETEISPEGEEILGIVQFSDGMLSMFTAGLKTRYDSTDNGETWAKVEGPGANNPELEKARNIIASKDDALLVSVTDGNDMEIGGLKKILPDGTVEDFHIAEVEQLVQGGGFFINQLVRLSEDKIFISGTQNSGIQGFSEPDSQDGEDDGDNQNSEEKTTAIQGNNFVTSSNSAFIAAVFDAETGEKLYDVPGAQYAFSVTAADECFYLVGMDGQIITMAIADGTEIQKTDAVLPEGAGGAMANINTSILATLPIGTLYSLSSKGLYLVEPSTGEKETVMDGTGYSFGGAGTMQKDFLALSDNVFLILMDTKQGLRAYRYHYDENAKADPNKVLDIWALEENSIVRAAVNEFMKSHPDATVNLEVALSENSAQTANDAIQTLNTEILAGTGPDIIILDGLPAESYIQKGMLADISDKLDLSDVYAEIFEPLKVNGGLYYLPARFKTTLLVSDAETLAQLDTLEKLVEAIVSGQDIPEITPGDGDPFSGLAEEERPMIAFDSFSELFTALWSNSVSGVVENSEIQEENLRKFLEAIRAISDKYQLTQETQNGASGAMMVAGGDGEALTGNAMSYMQSRAKAAVYTLGTLVYLQMMDSGNSEYAVLPGLATGAYQPAATAGINAKSNAQEFAVEFLQSMLSAESQAAAGLGLPVTKAGLAAQMANNEDLKINEQEDSVLFDFDVQQILDTLTTPVLADAYLSDTVYAAAEALCKGEMDLDDAVSKIVQETKNYLAERI